MIVSLVPLLLHFHVPALFARPRGTGAPGINFAMRCDAKLGENKNTPASNNQTPVKRRPAFLQGVMLLSSRTEFSAFDGLACGIFFRNRLG